MWLKCHKIQILPCHKFQRITANIEPFLTVEYCLFRLLNHLRVILTTPNLPLLPGFSTSPISPQLVILHTSHLVPFQFHPHPSHIFCFNLFLLHRSHHRGHAIILCLMTFLFWPPVYPNFLCSVTGTHAFQFLEKLLFHLKSLSPLSTQMFLKIDSCNHRKDQYLFGV